MTGVFVKQRHVICGPKELQAWYGLLQAGQSPSRMGHIAFPGKSASLEFRPETFESEHAAEGFLERHTQLESGVAAVQFCTYPPLSATELGPEYQAKQQELVDVKDRVLRFGEEVLRPQLARYPTPHIECPGCESRINVKAYIAHTDENRSTCPVCDAQWLLSAECAQRLTDLRLRVGHLRREREAVEMARRRELGKLTPSWWWLVGGWCPATED